MSSPQQELKSLFTYLDEEGVAGRTASAEIVLSNGEIMTVSAGGPGTHSRPARSPFEAYEVLMDHLPPRFWKRYSQEETEALYANVPRLLVTHHITRAGGIAQIACHVTTKHRTVVMNLTVPEEYEKAVWMVINSIKDAQMLSAIHVLQ